MNFLSDGDTKGAASKLFRFCSARLVGDCKGGTEMNSFRYKCELFKVVSFKAGVGEGRQERQTKAACESSCPAPAAPLLHLEQVLCSRPVLL